MTFEAIAAALSAGGLTWCVFAFVRAVRRERARQWAPAWRCATCGGRRIECPRSPEGMCLR